MLSSADDLYFIMNAEPSPQGMRGVDGSDYYSLNIRSFKGRNLDTLFQHWDRF